MSDDSFGYISQYPNPDQSGGFFGGGYYTTFNGFASLNAILNVFLSLITALLIFFPGLTKKMLIAPLIIGIILFVLKILEIVIAPYLLSESDDLLSGFYILRICEIGIFWLVFSKAAKNTSEIISDNLLDN